MEKELVGVFGRTPDAHFPEEAGITREAYMSTFERLLRSEIREPRCSRGAPEEESSSR
jgi:hypothetical protein